MLFGKTEPNQNLSNKEKLGMDTEKCIICNKKVIDEKGKYYITGAGQLCPDCYEELYIFKKENSK